MVDEINKKMDNIDILIEVNVGNEPSKSGVSENDINNLIEYILQKPNIHLKGLMCIPPYFEDIELVRPYFIKLRELRDKLQKDFNIELKELSMGMSSDFEIAIEEGATIVRIGTLIFGERM